MFVNKINNMSFKGFQPSIGNEGELTYKFTYPHDKNQDVKIELYKANAKTSDKPLKTINLNETSEVNFDEIPELSKNDAVKYRIYVDGQHVVDTGYYTDSRDGKNGFNIINRNGTSPFVQGQSILTMIDSHRPGAKYADFNSEKTGSIEYDINKQKASENVIRTFSNKGGGSLAGIEYDLDKLQKMGIKKIFMTPVWGGDNLSSHRYWNKNDMQIADEIGNINTYKTFIRGLFSHGMQYVDDFAVTSFGLESWLSQYVLKWANYKPFEQYMLKINCLDNSPITLGVVPDDIKNLRHRVVNPTVIYNPKTNTIEKNPDYDSNKETYFQIYDATQVTEEQLNKKNELIEHYYPSESEKNMTVEASCNNVLNYSFEIQPKEYENRLKAFAEINKNSSKPIELNSPEGTLFIGQFTHFKIGKDAEGAVFWDANKDLFKRNYYISGYDEKLLNAIPNATERNKIRELMKRANYSTQDMAIQAGIYRTQVVADEQLLYLAQTLKGANRKEDIDKLIGVSLPNNAQLNDEEIENIKDGWYNLAPKLVENKDDITTKALMKLPLGALEVGENTSGVLSTPFFSKLAVSEESIGLSRYDFYKQGAGLYSPYHKVYHSVDGLYENQIREFADNVIKKVNESSKEKLLDENQKYTEYGEYVIDIIGQDIAKYALLKAIAGDKLQTKVMSDDVLKGEIAYNYPELRKATTLKALGINASSPEEEANALFEIISNGLDNLTNADINYVADAISKKIEGTNTTDFRLGEAIRNKLGLGLDFRLDASKDIADMDAVRSGSLTFDRAWDNAIDFWKKFVKEIKKINPNAYIVAEITDVADLMKAQYGKEADVWNTDLSKVGGKYKNVSDAIKRFYDETGITSEAGYSYTFTDLMRVFSADAESGTIIEKPLKKFADDNLNALLTQNNLDVIRNLWTFADNHDKPSMIHSMALDMELFNITNFDADFKGKREDFEKDKYEIKKRNARIANLQELTNSDKFEDLPLEAMMNIDNKAYFRTANSRSTAMSQVMRRAVIELEKQNTNIDTKSLKSAISDLTAGIYLSNEEGFKAQTIKLPELQTIEGALNSIIAKSGITLSEEEKKAVSAKAKERSRVEKYTIQADFDWKTSSGETHWGANILIDRANNIIGNTDNLMSYSPYTINIASLILDSAKEVVTDEKISSLKSGAKSFVKEFNREKIEANSDKLPLTEDNQRSINKKIYAARDFETVIEMIIKQAELKSGKNFTKEQHDLILKTMFIESTQTSIVKSLMYSTYLSALVGIPSLYYRDILGGLGFDEKAKNMFLQNRNTVKYSQIEEDNPLKEYRTAIFNSFKEIMQIREQKGLEALNGGTPYKLQTSNDEVLAMLYQGKTDEDVAITVMNSAGIKPQNNAEYKTSDGKTTNIPQNDEVELESIVLPAAIALPIGMEFVDAMAKNSSSPKYVINKLNGIYSLVRKDGGKIKLNRELSTMFLKRVAFKGRNINKQYNLVTNPYQTPIKENLGENLLIVSK